MCHPSVRLLLVRGSPRLSPRHLTRSASCHAQGPSPDEVALVDAARQVGFVFKERLQSSVVLDMLGQEVTYEVLNVMEYSSDRWAGVGADGERQAAETACACTQDTAEGCT